MLYFYYLIIIILILCLTFEPWKSRKSVILGKRFQNDYVCLPLLGHVYLLIGSGIDRMKTIKYITNLGHGRKHGLVTLWFGHLLHLCVTDIDIANTVLNNRDCLDKPYLVHKISSQLIGYGSIFAPVHIWRPRRKVVASMFSIKNLKNFVEVFNRKSSILVDELKSTVDKGDICAWSFVSAMTLDSICETTMGVDLDITRRPAHVFNSAFVDFLKRGAERVARPWLYPDFIYKRHPAYKKQCKNKEAIHNFIKEVIKKEKVKYKAEKDRVDSENGTENVTKSFLRLMIESGSLTDVELLEELIILVLAGMDTSAVNTCFVMMMLAQHPDVQQRVFKEICDVFKDNSVTYEKLLELNYTEAVIKETLRLYPPVPIVARICWKDIAVTPDITFYKDTNVIINIFGILRNPRYWGPNSDDFDPNRFVNELPRNNNAFIPFSLGPRNCIGGTYAITLVKSNIANILRRYVLLPAEDSDKEAGHQLTYATMLKQIKFSLRIKSR